MNRQLKNNSNSGAGSGKKWCNTLHPQKYVNSLLIAVLFIFFLIFNYNISNAQTGAQMVLREKIYNGDGITQPTNLLRLPRTENNVQIFEDVDRILYYAEIVADPTDYNNDEFNPDFRLATLSSLTFNLAGDFVSGDIESLSLYYYPSYDNEGPNVAPLEFEVLSTIIAPAAPGTYTFSNIDQAANSIIQKNYPLGDNTSGLFVITMNVNDSYRAGSSVYVPKLLPENFGFLENDAELALDGTNPPKDGGETGFIDADCDENGTANNTSITYPTSEVSACGSITATKTGGTSIYWQTTPTGTSTANNGASYNYSGSSKFLYIRYRNPSNCWSIYILRTAEITINQSAVIGTQPSNLTVNAGASATFSVVLSPTNSSATYQWQESTDNGGSWSDIINGAPFSNVTTATLTISPVTGDFNSYQYRCIVSVPICGNVPSNSATLTVNAGSIYRSSGSNGAWSNAASWLVSTTGDDGTFVAASHPPDNTTTSIDIQHNINLDATVSLNLANLNIAASGHLTLDGASTISGGSPASVLTVYGLLTTTDKDGLQCASCPFNTTGWTINLNTGSTIEYNYADIEVPIDDQIITPLTYHHLKLVNTSTVKKTNGATMVNGTLTLGAPLKTTNGTLSLGNTGIIDFDESAVQSALTIEGPIAKVFNAPFTAFTFPLGSAAFQQPITVWPITESGVTYTVEYVNGNPATLFGANVTGAELNGLYTNKYWKVKRSGSFGSARIGLSYVNPNSAGAWSTSSNPPPFSAIALAHLGTNGYWQFSKNDKDFSDQAGNEYYEALPPTLNDTVFTGSLTTFTSGSGGVNDFVPITFGYGTAAILTLPVQIITFEAKAFTNNEVKLTWKLEETQDLKTICIQVSADGRHFSNLTQWGYTQSQGKQMSYTHKNAGVGTIYYRLQLRSKDGSLRYSRVRLVEPGVDVTVLTGILQNPVWGKEVIATLHAAKPQRIFAHIVDIAGRKVSQQQLAVGKGEAQWRIPVYTLPKGWYFLQICTEDGKQRTDKFQIQ